MENNSNKELKQRLQVEITRDEYLELRDRMLRKFGDDQFDKYRKNATFYAVIECLLRGSNAIDLINQLISTIESQQDEMKKHYATCPGWMNQFVRESNE